MKKDEVYGAADRVCAETAETNVKVAEVCRQMGISEANFYSWKRKYGELGTTELRKLNQLQEESSQLKRIVAI